MRRTVVLLSLAALAAPAAAQENNDLNLIPGAVASATPAVVPVEDRGRYSLSDALGWYSYRGTLAVPATVPSRWNDRLSADALVHWNLSPKLTFTLSDVFSASFADGVGFPRQSLRNDLREAYFTWEAAPETYLEAGRINVRGGIAFGYNPTDFFRARTSVAQSSSDPGALKNNRLGTVMLRAQRVFTGGSLELIYAPKLHSPVPLGGVAWPLDPKIDQTNGADRLLVSYSFALEEFSPQVLFYYEDGRSKIGFNASHTIGAAIIAYVSWAGSDAPSVIADAYAFGKRTRTLPPSVPVLPAVSGARGFRNDLSLGAYWSGEDEETISFEYNFHEAGLTGPQWRDWFAVGAQPGEASLMWYIREYVGDRQDPISRHRLFVRADWVEPFHILHADLNAYVMTSPTDGSCTGQIGASYDLSDQWSLGAYVSASSGGRKSEWGSLTGAASAIVQIVRYL